MSELQRCSASVGVATTVSNIAAALALTLALGAAACGSSRTEPKAADRPALDVATVTVTVSDLPQAYEAGGVVRAHTTAAITSRLLAPVLDVRVMPGDHVRAGQVLIRLDDRDLSAQQRRAASGREAADQAGRAAAAERDAAKAALALATAHHKRMQMLHERKSATDEELDQAVAGLQAAQSRLSAAEARIAEASAGLSAAVAGADAATIGASWATITAPFDGVITEKLVEPGNMASPGLPLLRIEQAGALRVDVRLDESRAAGFHTGQDVDVRFDSDVLSAAGPGAGPQSRLDRVTGRIAEIARAADAGAHSFLVKIDLPADVRVPSGAFARALFSGPPRPVLAVPHAALVRRGQLTSVFVVEGELARLRLISVGDTSFSRSGGDLVEVLAGLQDGERVVVAPSPALRDGTRVRAGAAPRASAASAGEAR